MEKAAKGEVSKFQTREWASENVHPYRWTILWILDKLLQLIFDTYMQMGALWGNVMGLCLGPAGFKWI